MYIKKEDGIRFHPHYGRLMEHRGYSLRIYWNKQMLDYLRRHFPTMLNDELAGCLGVSSRTVVRKARELGLQKDPEWLAVIWAEASTKAAHGNADRWSKAVKEVYKKYQL